MYPGGSARVLHVTPEAGPSTRALRRALDAVETAPDAAAGFSRYRDGDVDCVVVPQVLPDADGLSLLLAVRAEDRRTPVVVYDHRDDPALALRVAELGGTYHRTTGDPDRLGGTVRRTLASRAARATGVSEGRRTSERGPS